MEIAGHWVQWLNTAALAAILVGICIAIVKVSKAIWEHVIIPLKERGLTHFDRLDDHLVTVDNQVGAQTQMLEKLAESFDRFVMSQEAQKHVFDSQQSILAELSHNVTQLTTATTVLTQQIQTHQRHKPT